MKKIAVVVWDTEDSGEDSRVYRVDLPGEGERFFRDLSANAELDGREELTLTELTDEEWAECVKLGKELS